MSDRVVCIECGGVCSGCLTGCNHVPCPYCDCIREQTLDFLCEHCGQGVVEEPGLFCVACQESTGRKSWQYSTTRGYYV